MRRLGARFLVSVLTLAGGVVAAALAAPSDAPVVVVPITGYVDEGMAHMVSRAVSQAQDEHAAGLVLDVNSVGGVLEAAYEARDAVLNARVPTYAYVSERANSSAALISLAAQKIVMAPGASIGEGEPSPKTPKLVSAVKAEFESTALRNHRDPRIVAAMVDSSIDLPRYKQPGQNLTLDTQDAIATGIASGEQPTLDAMLAANGLNGPVERPSYTLAEEVARFATNPEISGLLLTLGLLGLLIEMQTLHGIAGIIGVGALALFFGAHVYAGFSNGLVLVLAVVGVIGILYELHVVPGHGLPGILGGVFLLAAVLLAFGLPFFVLALQTVATAIVLTIVLFWMALRAFPENAWIARLTFAGAQGADYVASADHTPLRGQSGVAASYLRPAGVALIDGQRVDVLTRGEFIPEGTPVRVTRVEGARIFVEPISLPSYKE